MNKWRKITAEQHMRRSEDAGDFDEVYCRPDTGTRREVGRGCVSTKTAKFTSIRQAPMRTA